MENEERRTRQKNDSLTILIWCVKYGLYMLFTYVVYSLTILFLDLI